MGRRFFVLVSLSLSVLAASPGTMGWPAAGASPVAASIEGGTALSSQDDGAELRDAARSGDVETVRSMLESGVDVDASDRYGSTALFFAADRGHLQIVELLLEAGADPDRQDSFYGMSPLSRALSSGHRDVALLLLREGATTGAAAVLSMAVSRGDVELARAALETGAVDPGSIGAALHAARGAGKAEIVALLEPAAAAARSAGDELPAPDPETLRSYAGSYRNEEIGLTINVSTEGDALLVAVGEQDPVPATPAEGGGFTLPGGASLSFGGRGGIVERVVVEQGEQTFLFEPYDPDDAVTAADETREGARGPATSRTEPEEGVTAEEEVGPAPRGDLERSDAIDWPSFRGPGGSGVGDGQGIPTRWSVEDGTHVRWKSSIPGIANSSPIVWDDRVFVTTAVSASDDTVRTGLYGDVTPVEDLSPHTFELYCLDKDSGEILWSRLVHEGPPEVKRHPKSSQANSSPVTDGEHVVVLFGTVGILASYDLDGELQWKKQIGILDSGWFLDPSYQWGHASSPVLYEGLVIIQADVQRDSFVAAYSIETGEEVWRTPRESIPSFASPAVYRGEPRDELVTNGTRIRAYDPASGEPLWWLEPNSELVVGTPVIGEGLIFVTGGYPPVRPIYAIHPGGSGDISPPEPGESSDRVVWSTSRGGTYIPTPIVYGGLLYMNHNDGRLEVLEADTGERVYRERIGGVSSSYVASPVAADGRLYFSTEDGTVHVVRAGREYEHLAGNDMGEVIWATPAISDGLLILRTLGHVWGIGYEAAADAGR